MIWIYTKDELPPDIGTPYQVIAATKKELGGNYKGKSQRGFYQDWVVRRWPNNFIAWMSAPSHIEHNASAFPFLAEFRQEAG